MIEFILVNKEILGVTVSFLSVVIPLAIFLISKAKEQSQINFERFHTYLIKGLSNQDGKTGFDDQVAIIYEFRNYSDYYPVIRRLLKFQINRWNAELKSKPHYRLIINEAEETIAYMSKISLYRFFIDIKSKWF